MDIPGASTATITCSRRPPLVEPTAHESDMPQVASPGSSPTTFPPTAEASWDDRRQSSGSVSASELDVIPGAYEFDDLISEPDAESPTPPNKDVSLPRVPRPLEDPVSALTISVSRVDPDFCFDDSNITVKAEICLFRVHTFKLKEFKRMRLLVEAVQKDSEGRKTIELSGSAGDFHNMFTVLYSSAYDPQSFDATILKSTLRLSTIHDHPQLRTFAIQNLEKLTLPPIERFALSRDCNVESWMSNALDDLCQREAPITTEEADILGTKKFVELAARREELKFKRGSRAVVPASLAAPASSAITMTKQIELAPTPSTDTSSSSATSSSATVSSVTSSSVTSSSATPSSATSSTVHTPNTPSPGLASSATAPAGLTGSKASASLFSFKPVPPAAPVFIYQPKKDSSATPTEDDKPNVPYFVFGQKKD